MRLAPPQAGHPRVTRALFDEKGMQDAPADLDPDRIVATCVDSALATVRF